MAGPLRTSKDETSTRIPLAKGKKVTELGIESGIQSSRSPFKKIPEAKPGLAGS